MQTDEHSSHVAQLAQELLGDQKQLTEICKITDPRHPLNQVIGLALKKIYQQLFEPGLTPALLEEIKDYWIPIANNFGMWEIRYCIEDRIFELTDKKNYKLICSLVQRKQKMRQDFFHILTNIVTHYLQKAGLKDFDILFRQKNVYGMYIKMQRRQQNINYMTDWFGIRILVNSVDECYKTMDILHYLWRPHPEFFKDYIKSPKPNGYQSIHTTLHCLESQNVEFQIRTKEMDFAAKYGAASHGIYKRLNS